MPGSPGKILSFVSSPDDDKKEVLNWQLFTNEREWNAKELFGRTESSHGSRSQARHSGEGRLRKQEGCKKHLPREMLVTAYTRFSSWSCITKSCSARVDCESREGKTNKNESGAAVTLFSTLFRRKNFPLNPSCHLQSFRFSQPKIHKNLLSACVQQSKVLSRGSCKAGAVARLSSQVHCVWSLF